MDAQRDRGLTMQQGSAAGLPDDARPAVWVLNLDADHELDDPQGYVPSQRVQQRVRAFAQRARSLLRAGDVLVAELEERGALPLEHAERYEGRAWCPTPRALAQLRRAGVVPPPSPALGVLQRVNDRRFSVELDPGPLEAAYVTDLESALSRLRQPSFSGRWLMKRAFGLAGRGHRRVDGVPSEDDRRWLANSFQRGHGVSVEPWAPRIADFAIHGWLERDGTLTLGRALLQECDAHGAWRETRPLPPSALLEAEHEALVAGATRAGHALHEAGYFGPFGIDAFAYRDGSGRRAFQPIVEINARYSMGWPLSGLTAGRLV